MFSQLGPLFKTVFRAAEHADARLEIRREEKENGRKKGEDESTQDDTSALWEDSTNVSVSALRTFLIEFLQKQGADASAPVNAPESPAQTTPEPAPPVSPIAARAVKAYGAMSAQNSPPPVLPPAIETPKAPEQTDLASLLESEEIRQIHRLIAELDSLARGGIESLSIQLDGKTFLDAVEDAVRLQKGNS